MKIFWPILGDLYEALLRYDPKNIEKELAREAKAKAVRIANSLVLYVKCYTNVVTVVANKI